MTLRVAGEVQDWETLADVRDFIDARTADLPHQAISRNGHTTYFADGGELARWVFDNAHPYDLELAITRLDATVGLLAEMRTMLLAGASLRESSVALPAPEESAVTSWGQAFRPRPDPIELGPGWDIAATVRRLIGRPRGAA